MQRLRCPLRLTFGALGVLVGAVIAAVISDFWWPFVGGSGIVVGCYSSSLLLANEQWDTMPPPRAFWSWPHSADARMVATTFRLSSEAFTT